MREAARKAHPAGVGGQPDPPSAAQHDLRQRLGGKHVAAGSAGGDDKEPAAFAHPILRRESVRAYRGSPLSMSPSPPCGRVRVKARSSPMAIPPAISDDPP